MATAAAAVSRVERVLLGTLEMLAMPPSMSGMLVVGVVARVGEVVRGLMGVARPPPPRLTSPVSPAGVIALPLPISPPYVTFLLRGGVGALLRGLGPLLSKVCVRACVHQLIFMNPYRPHTLHESDVHGRGGDQSSRNWHILKTKVAIRSV